MAGLAKDWSVDDVKNWIMQWYTEDKQQVLRAIESKRVDGKKLLTTPDINDVLDDMSIADDMMRSVAKRKINSLNKSDSSARRESIDAEAQSAPSRQASQKGKPAAQVSETMYSMFPEFDRASVDQALEHSSGSESEMLDYLFALRIAQRQDDAPKDVTPECSQTKGGLDDEDIFDDFVEGFEHDIPSASHGDDEDIYIDIAEIQQNHTLINNMRGCLDQVVGEADASTRVLPAALFDPKLDGELTPVEAIERLARFFPDLDEDHVRQVFESSGGDLEGATRELQIATDNASGAEAMYMTLEPASDTYAVIEPDTHDAGQEPLYASFPIIGKTGTFKTRKSSVKDGAGAADKAAKTEKKRREAVLELLETERTYLSDVNALLEVFIEPMKGIALKRSGASKTIYPTFSGQLVQSMHASVQKMFQTGEKFKADLRPPHSDAQLPERVAETVLKWGLPLKRSFLWYCGTCFHLQQALKDPTPAMKELLQTANKDARSRGLPASSFLLVPIQRLARYPMLIQAILDRTVVAAEQADLEKALVQTKQMAKACNDRLQNLDDTQTMKMINDTLDFSRIEKPTPVFLEGRRLVKRGLVKIAVLNAARKITKSKAIELILLTDMVIYGKRTKSKKCLVYKQVHRSFITARAASDKADMFSLTILSEGRPVKIYLQCDTKSTRDRWLKMFNPSAGESDREESVYQEWDCPQVRAVKDWTPPSTAGDDLALRVGDIINVSAKDETGWYKGTVIRTIHTTHRKTTGWFPQKFIKELPTMHAKAKGLRKKHEESKQQATSKQLSDDNAMYATAFK